MFLRMPKVKRNRFFRFLILVIVVVIKILWSVCYQPMNSSIVS